MANKDLVLLETVRTHRARLVSAFLYGALEERRVANDNLRRLVGGVVLAAIACTVCIGYSLITSVIARQSATQRAQAGQGPATGVPYVADAFDRDDASGWGRADLGGAWQLLGRASAYAVDDGEGLIELSDDARGAWLPQDLTDRSDLTVTLGRPDGGGEVEAAVLGRRVSGSEDYRAVVRLDAGGGVSVTLLRRALTENGDPPQAAVSDTLVLRSTSQTGREGQPAWTVRMQAVGTNPTVLRAKVWPASASEPEAWGVTGSDSSGDLQRPGAVGVDAERTSGAGGELRVLDLVARAAA